jgi:acetyl esterase/lipase
MFDTIKSLWHSLAAVGAEKPEEETETAYRHLDPRLFEKPPARAKAAPSTRVPALAPSTFPCAFDEESIVYKTTARGPLHVHVARPRGAPPPGGRPAMVFFHGGGWRRGTPQQFMPFAKVLAQHGMLAMSAEYRLIENAFDPLPREAVADARSAMRWLRREAASLGADPARIGAGGGSSGAHLALMTALGTAAVEDADDDRSIDPRPDALVLLNAPFDFDAYESDVPLEVRHAYSPHHLLKPTLPPALVLHGTNDQVIPYEQVLAFHRRAEDLGVKGLRIVPFVGRGHGFFNRGKGDPGDFARTNNEIAKFLERLGWIGREG